LKSNSNPTSRMANLSVMPKRLKGASRQAALTGM
jgi:hypothetical protein